MDHMERSRELLVEVEDLRTALIAEHESPTGTSKNIARLYDGIRHTTALAKIHATLAVAQAVQDRSNFRGLAQ